VRYEALPHHRESGSAPDRARDTAPSGGTVHLARWPAGRLCAWRAARAPLGSAGSDRRVLGGGRPAVPSLPPACRRPTTGPGASSAPYPPSVSACSAVAPSRRETRNVWGRASDPSPFPRGVRFRGRAQWQPARSSLEPVSSGRRAHRDIDGRTQAGVGPPVDQPSASLGSTMNPLLRTGHGKTARAASAVSAVTRRAYGSGCSEP
jgi:hypothetical protein